MIRRRMHSLNDRTLRIVGPLVLWVVATLFFNLSTLLDADINRWRFITYGIFTLYLSWFVIRWLILQAQRRFAGLERTNQRLVWLGGLGIPVTALLVGARILLTRYYVFTDAAHWEPGDIPFMYGVGLFYFTIIVSIYEARYFFRQWLRTKRQAEELQRTQLEIQLSLLRTQVQPHFLFNSLNTLQALVKTNENSKAVQFIGDLAQVYRYLLQSNEQPLILLEDELAFTHAYLNLLKTRFDEGLRVDVGINPAYRAYRLPPLTLQLLVENAVKHNIVSASRPLTISIRSNGHPALVVRNNLQRKARADVASDKKGLLTITQKYRLLGHDTVLIEETPDFFTVEVPLIAP
ncbi:sensor histidine kinase [Fibrisoma montanum]|nr:histidine kinase [Fibrisoma montanum]